MKYTLGELAEILKAKLVGNPDAVVNYVVTDSRSVAFPETTLFVALHTSKNDGHRYIPSLSAEGVHCFLVSDLPAHPDNDNFLVVSSPLQALQRLAAHHRHAFRIPVIGITGSNGKTVVKEWLYQLLQSDCRITRSPRSYNSQIGVPLSVLQLNGQSQLAVFEAGISQPGEMDHLARTIQPTVGFFTHLGEAHQENFASLKQKVEEKIRLFSSTDIVFYGSDDKLLEITLQQAQLSARLFSWGRTEGADVRLVSEKVKDRTTLLSCRYEGKVHHLSVPFVDTASVENAMLCISYLLFRGMPDDELNRRLASLQPVAMRLETINGRNGCLLVNDSYNNDLGSLGIALDYLNVEAAAKGLKKTLILSDIYESGQSESDLWLRVCTLLKNKKVNRLIGVGPNISAAKDVFLKGRTARNTESFDCSFFATTAELLASTLLQELHNEAILLKGARPFRFEDLSAKLSDSVHQTVLEVDLTALLHNVAYFRSFLKPTTKMVHMVKANAYGSGDVAVARALQEYGCDYLAVATADEGANLRNEGIHVPVIVMNPELGGLAKIIDYHLEPEIYSFSMLDAFLDEANKQGVTDYPVHVKINTGMNRLGFEPSQVDELIRKLKSQDALLVRSVFSHFVGSDEARFDSFTEEQVRRFQTATDKLQQAFPYRILKHICNSAGIERFPQYQFDMVRLGIGHYGFAASGAESLEEVCSLKTTILQTRKVPRSETVSYCRNGKLDRDSLIGAIPIGYADGLDRHLGNRNGAVWVNGHLAPIVGNVCMDVCMIDLTGIDAKEGDTVEVFGKNYSIRNLARQLGTISYEVLTGISLRVKRVYFKE
ncbi:MAG: bifunctional UDP-N-acetylmuramoyl-tripeptide:D-alanyl-D-alanine ligase/alanine racemase [Paludibacteraceae bacterium]|nr:bifunctional UDP-N-acetylmuramoyl-tripeptide:D-alanyl-D-alanine ligase/alanine racemase [Paludibacteraceae bacterium]